MREPRALAAHDELVVLRLDRVDGVRERVGRGERVEQQRPAEVGVVARRAVDACGSCAASASRPDPVRYDGLGEIEPGGVGGREAPDPLAGVVVLA